MSVAYRILTAARGVVNALDLPDVAAVHVRKRPVCGDEDFASGRDTLITVSIGTEETDEEHTENLVNVIYPVTVAVFQRGKLQYERATEVLLECRERIRQALHKPTLSGVTEVFDCSYDPAPPFDESALSAGYDVSAQRFKFSATEDRSE